MQSSKKILVVEDSPTVLRVIHHVLGLSEQIVPVYSERLKDVEQLLEQPQQDFFAAVVDLNLPDAPNGEVVDLMLSHGIPTIVLTGSFDSGDRARLLSKGVLDYVIKEGRHSYEYARTLIHRLIKNQGRKVLVVDDSQRARQYIARLLRQYQFDVLEAADGFEAVRTLICVPGVRLLITDQNMPNMDGVDLVRNLRARFDKSELLIVGLSSAQDECLSAKFIKAGANDFLRTPFSQEEFYCRITHNMEMIELIDELQDAARRDVLTGSYNRSYFFDKGRSLLEQSREQALPLTAAVLELDNFHHIAQSYGSVSADMVLQEVARRLQVIFSRFFLARAKDATFLVLLPGLELDKARALVDRVREVALTEPIEAGDELISLTLSAGVACSSARALDEVMNAAAQSLVRAKEAGGDIVLVSE